MKKITGAALLLIIVSLSASAIQSGSKKETIEQLVKSVAKAFTGKTLASLDRKNINSGRLKVVVEHSLADDNDKGRFETKIFKNFAKIEQWLKGRETDGMPARSAFNFKRCKNGVCSYDGNALLHNHVYLQKITYGISNGHYYIKSIHVLDGD